MHLTSYIAAAAVLLASTAVSFSAAEVIDGDSLMLDGHKVELWGVVAPEKSEMCRTSSGQAWPCGQAALDQLQQLSADETFVCEPKEPGFVICRAAGFDVARLLVKEGLVRARQDYHDTEARAREAKVGIWE
jgi:endonuclease YncB( thermonuclease family)